MAFTILKTITTTALVPVEVVEVRCQYGMVPDPCASCGHTGDYGSWWTSTRCVTTKPRTTGGSHE